MTTSCVPDAGFARYHKDADVFDLELSTPMFVIATPLKVAPVGNTASWSLSPNASNIVAPDATV
jgi:hypothetical protein